MQVLLLACNCPYSLEYVTHSRLLCGTNPHEVIYQSNLLNTDGQTASELVGLVQMWVDNGPTLPVAGVSAVVDPYCQISLSQVGNTEECIALNPTTPTTIESTKQSSPRPTAAIVGGVAGGVATIVFVVLIVGLLCACRRTDSSRHLTIKKRNERLSTTPFGTRPALIAATPAHYDEVCDTLLYSELKKQEEIQYDEVEGYYDEVGGYDEVGEQFDEVEEFYDEVVR